MAKLHFGIKTSMIGTWAVVVIVIVLAKLGTSTTATTSAFNGVEEPLGLELARIKRSPTTWWESIRQRSKNSPIIKTSFSTTKVIPNDRWKESETSIMEFPQQQQGSRVLLLPVSSGIMSHISPRPQIASSASSNTEIFAGRADSWDVLGGTSDSISPVLMEPVILTMVGSLKPNLFGNTPSSIPLDLKSIFQGAISKSIDQQSSFRSSRSLAPRSNYCAIAKDHTACKYTKVNQEGKCGKIKDRGLKFSGGNWVLDMHNYLRKVVANGLISKITASNMVELTWDEEAASIAQLWADQCMFRKDANRQTLKSSKGNPLYNGQNILSMIDPKSRVPLMDAMAEQWVLNEEAKLKSAGIAPNGPRNGAENLTQLGWAETRTVGCGYIRVDDERRLICNYGPGGNDRKKPIFLVGKPCSACPPGFRHCDEGICTRKAPDPNKKFGFNEG